MLDRSQLLKQLNALSHALFIDYSGDYELARAIWEKISRDASSVYAVRAAQSSMPLLLPTWDPADLLGDCFLIDTACFSYSAISVDGSQIYPDRHQGTSCFLINVGAVALSYGHSLGSGSRAQLSCWPTVYSGQEMHIMHLSTDFINGQRQEAELRAGVELCVDYVDKEGQTPVLLFDGSLVFWHLEAQDTRLREHFLPNYLHSLQQLYEKRIPVVGYISAPRNRELVNIIKLFLTLEAKEQEADELSLVDAHIAGFFLPSSSRSIVFKNHAAICGHYPPALQPHFFYVQIDDEIGRVEIPAWVAEDRRLVDYIASVIIDQNKKGYGYPIAIAEAHEQAVVKGADRDFFYQIISRLSVEHRQRMRLSQKSIKKRRAHF